MERSRAWRRAQKERIFRKAKAVAKSWGWWESDERAEHFARRNCDNLQNCSCTACGNQRKHGKGREKLTIQERKHL